MMPECKEFCESWRRCTGCFDCQLREDNMSFYDDNIIDAMIAEDELNQMEAAYRGLFE